MAQPANPALIRVADLKPASGLDFALEPDAEARASLAAEIGADALRKLRFSGRIEAEGRRDWRLTGRLGATVVQPCVVTLEPVTTRIDTDVRRLYLADYAEPDESEAEMPEDETIEALPAEIDLDAVMAEALVLALPLYPRAPGAATGEAVFTEPGKQPMRDEDTRPFAGLAQLRDKLARDDGPDG